MGETGKDENKTMTIEEYIHEVIKDLDLSEMLIGKISNDLRKELTSEVEGGLTEEQATAQRGWPEQVAIELMQKYDKTAQQKQSREGKLPMVFWWGLMLSSLLFSIKWITCMWVGGTTFDKFGVAAGAAGMVLCGFWALGWFIRKKKQENQ